MRAEDKGKLSNDIDAIAHKMFNNLLYAITEQIEKITKKYGYEIKFMIPEKKYNSKDITIKLMAMIGYISETDNVDMKIEINHLFKSINNESLKKMMAERYKDKL